MLRHQDLLEHQDLLLLQQLPPLTIQRPYWTSLPMPQLLLPPPAAPPVFGRGPGSWAQSAWWARSTKSSPTPQRLFRLRILCHAYGLRRRLELLLLVHTDFSR